MRTYILFSLLFLFRVGQISASPLFQCQDALAKLGGGEFKSLGWATDIHLDFTDHYAVDIFIAEANRAQIDALMISGDISVSDYLENHLRHLAYYFQKPIFFVLGNHDFYGSEIQSVREKTAKLTDEVSNLFWLPRYKPIHLNETHSLIGVDGWGDATVGNVITDLDMNDFRKIEDLIEQPIEIRNFILNSLGKESAEFAKKALEEAFETRNHVILVTHVPPFKESYVYKKSGDYPDHQPFFINGQLGVELVKTMKQYPYKKLLVLCGHGHYPALFSPLPNITVETAGAAYGYPLINSIINTGPRETGVLQNAPSPVVKKKIRLRDLLKNILFPEQKSRQAFHDPIPHKFFPKQK